MEKITTIYNDFINNNYKITCIKDDTHKLPKTVDIKDSINYYLHYLYQRDSPLFVKLIDYVLIPNSTITVKDMDEFINMITYVKYNIEAKEIELKHDNISTIVQIQEKQDIFENMTVKEFKQYCRDNKITNFVYNEEEDKIEVVIRKSEENNFNKLTVNELKAYCREHTIKGYSKLRKREIIELINTSKKINQDSS